MLISRVVKGVEQMRPEKDTPEALAREIAIRMKNEQKEGMLRNELRERIAKEYGLRAEHVRRYLRLLHLIPELLQMVNEEKMLIHTGSELSFLSEENQRILCDYLIDAKCTISIHEATYLKKEYRNRILPREELENIFRGKGEIEVLISYGRTDMDSFTIELSEKELLEKVYKAIHKWEDSKKMRA